MAFQTSPGVNVSEIDLTNIVPAVSTTEGAIAGTFRWGPENIRTLVTSEADLADRFGKPATYYTNAALTTQWTNHETWFSAANFLAYSDALFVVRTCDGTAAAATSTNISAKYKGLLGNSIKISHCTDGNFEPAARAYTITIAPQATTGSIAALPTSAGASTFLSAGDNIVLSDGTLLEVASLATATGSGSSWTQVITFKTAYNNHTQYAAQFSSQWGDADLFDAGPTAGGIHLIVRDTDGKISGTAGTIIERWENINCVSTAKNTDGSTNFITDVLDQGSNWIAVSVAQSALLAAAGITYGSATLTGGLEGADEVNATLATVAPGYDLFKDPADVDISLIIQGRAIGVTLANYIIANICDVRKDCVLFVSPELSDTTAQNIVDFAKTVTATTFAVIDSGYKYQYDKYSDVYRWIPLNGDIAGICARTDDVRDPWFSPAGYNRGQVKNVVKLKLNATRAQRDLLYKHNVNPVITQPGQGTVLFGDKTNAGAASAFDRINVRRLFIVLEKAIGVAAKSTLFEFNDEFTRAQFKNLVEPFLRDVQGRRGIYDFRVVVDATNNTAAVVDANQFIGDIYIKPARSINFIQLNFVAVRSGVEFTEVVGQF